MIHLNSSAIRAADYDPASRRMYLWFPNNGPYTYYGVPERIYLRLVHSSSPGTFYKEVIRGNYSA
ncbi:MAG TPA: KTSC domain-containing protein [Verrucomicrobiales bacterium]|nr:KTSC domain-containing protein [Verrucomicrobiales bacterium]